MQLSRDISKRQRYFRDLHPCSWHCSLLEELGHTARNGRDIGCHGCKIWRSLEKLLVSIGLSLDSLNVTWVAQWTQLHVVFTLHCTQNLALEFGIMVSVLT